MGHIVSLVLSLALVLAIISLYDLSGSAVYIRSKCGNMKLRPSSSPSLIVCVIKGNDDEGLY